MAVMGWLFFGAIAGVIMDRLGGESDRSMPLTVIGAMTGALLGGTIASAALRIGTIGYEAVVAIVLLAAAATALIVMEERRLDT